MKTFGFIKLIHYIMHGYQKKLLVNLVNNLLDDHQDNVE